MADDNKRTVELSRRNVLGAMGALGAAGALGGAGTAAFFSDEEQFENNTLVAGELDLKVDWQQTYYGPNGTVPINAYPDHDGDGWQSNANKTYAPGSPITLSCSDLASGARLPNDVFDAPNRTEGPVDQDSLVSLSDVKPGDEGEITFSLHICDNPGYLWMNGELQENAENGYTEPEASDPDETGSDDDWGGELADAIRTKLWYDDDCDNEVDGGEAGDDLDVMLVLDRSGSMQPPASKFQGMKDGAKTLVNTLTDDDQAGVSSFASNATRDVDLTDTTSAGKSSINTTIDGLTSGGSTNIQDGIEHAAEELLDDESLYSGNTTNPSGNAETDHTKIMVVLSNGGETTGDASAAAQTAKNNGIRVFSIAYGSGANTSLLQDIASSGDFYDSTDVGDIQQVFQQIAQDIAGEEVFFEGSLKEAFDHLSSDLGIPLDGDRMTDYDELVAAGDGQGRECFSGDTQHCIGFKWWLPVDHANEIQTDSVKFDLGFYTEQCRHNDGAGQAPETTSPPA